MTLSRMLPRRPRARVERGITTLAVTLLLLAIVTVIAIFATNTAFYELRTTTNENRARLAEQAAEYGVNLGGEYVKSQLENIVSEDAGGWMAAASPKWARCSTVSTPPAGHPCLAEANPTRRAQMYFATLADDTDVSTANDIADMVTAGGLTALALDATVNNTVPVELKIQALLCRIDTSDSANPECRLDPQAGNNIAVTLISTGAMDTENASAVVKETWASYGQITPASAVPLVAAGSVIGLGNAQIVASPNAGGTGLAASVWSPNDIDIEASSGGGVGSVSSCHLGGYLGHGAVNVTDMLEVCAGTGNTGCGCPGSTDPDFLSGHSQSLKRESLDILDRDGGIGSADLPDITFFPGAGIDKSTDPSDDNLFEWIFNVNYIAEQDGCNEDNAAGCSEDNNNGDTDSDCGDDDDTNCAIYAMDEELGFEFVTCAQMNALAEDAKGKYYVEDSPGGNCDLGGQFGTPDSSVIIVVDDGLRINGAIIYGMLFVRSDDNTAEMRGNGNAQVFGSAVVQGNVRMNGTLDIVFYDWGAEDPGGEPPPARFFGRVGGSWLDDDDGF